MRPLLFELSAAPRLSASVAEQVGAELGELDIRQFPDGETYLRFKTDVGEREAILLCTLDRPDPKLTRILFAAAAAREQGATSVGLVAPYLAYMRQDKEFHAGEAVTSKSFAKLVSGHFDWLVTVDPHLHRYPSLDTIYSVPAIAASATSALAEWIRTNVDRPVLFGPDEESRQWVQRIALRAKAQWTVLKKERTGDYSVSIDDEGLDHLGNGTPVIVDDIASSGRTLVEAARLIEQHGGAAPVCAVVHAIFAGDAFERLRSSGVARIVSTNTVLHESNAIDVSRTLAEAITQAATR